jgi:uncharacterized membrane protein YkoI
MALSLLTLLASTQSLSAQDGRRDHERAREARVRGDFIPLERLLADAERYGRVIDVELEGKRYEIEVLREDGRVIELEYDAYSGRMLESEFEDDD